MKAPIVWGDEGGKLGPFTIELYNGPVRGSSFVPDPEWVNCWNVEIKHQEQWVTRLQFGQTTTRTRAKHRAAILVAEWFATLCDIPFELTDEANESKDLS